MYGYSKGNEEAGGALAVRKCALENLEIKNGREEGEKKMRYNLEECRKFYAGKRVLVTGHTGFKGTWLCRILMLAGAKVTGYSLNPPTEPSVYGLLDIASFGIGNMTQANSISESLKSTFNFDEKIVGVVLTVLAIVIIVGGIKTISKVSSIVVPLMAIFYIIAGLIVVVMNIQNLPSGIVMIFKMAFSSQAVAGGGAGVITAGVMNAMRYGVARGVFSNEAGMGSAAITASAATTDDPVRQGYINMTGTFWDTIVVCTITGLCIASSGVLGTVGDDGKLVQGAALTILAFKSALGEVGAILVTIGIALFAFSTILGWEYHGEKAFEYIFGTHKYNMAYRIIFSLVVFVGATTTLQVVWNFSDIANALMAIPNLICLLVMSKVIAKEVERFQPILDKEKKAAKKKK